MKVEYNSNNSGGSWWLEDKDWINLEKAGWYVVWSGTQFCHSRTSFSLARKHKRKDTCASADKCKGHRISRTAKQADKNRYMGALARNAYKDFPSLREAIIEWEEITGQSATDEGCNCCGAPHTFSSKGVWCSGDDCAAYLYDKDLAGLSKRELLQKLKS